MIISIASGKGGTGKTTVAVSLALALVEKDPSVTLLDCDVEEPNSHIFVKPDIKERKPATVLVPEIDETKCNYCGKCSEVCAYNAIAVMKPKSVGKGHVLVFHNLCHSCGACALLCPQKAITEKKREIGVIESGVSGKIRFGHGKLNIGEAMAPPLIKMVKDLTDKSGTVIIDAPPGTSCSVVTSVQNTDYCLLVTEPTSFGLNDLELAVKVMRKLNIPCGVVINRAGMGDNTVDEYCRKENVPVLMRIPFDRKIAEQYSKGEPIIEGNPELAEKFRELFRKISEKADER